MVSILGIFISQCLYCQTVSTTSSTTENENSLLWKVEGNGIQPSYIYGTIHIIPKDDFFLTEETMEAFNESDHIVMELDMDDPNFQMQSVQAMQFTDGTSIKDYCSEEEYKQLGEAIAKFPGVTIDQLSGFKPMMLTSLLQLQLMGNAPIVSYEQELATKAVQSGKEVEGLESIQEQVQIFDHIPYDEQIDQNIKAFIHDVDNTKSQLAALTDAYKTQNIQKLYELILDQTEYEELVPKLLDERNEKWTQQVKSLCTDESCFFAVGAGHLAGEKGFLQLLRNQGYTVTPVQ